MPDQSDTPAAEILSFLTELAACAGQQAQAGTEVLELLIEDVTIRTSLQMAEAHRYLCITALLPERHDVCFCPALSHMDAADIFPEEGAPQSDGETTDYLWHADEGRYIVMRTVPLQHLRNHRDLMDAILNTFDQAQRYRALLDAEAGPAAKD